MDEALSSTFPKMKGQIKDKERAVAGWGGAEDEGRLILSLILEKRRSFDSKQDTTHSIQAFCEIFLLKYLFIFTQIS